MGKWIALLTALSLGACIKQGPPPSALHEEAAKEETIEDCQKLLSPVGYPEKDEYPEVVFTQRSCKGIGKAVTKMTRTKRVYVVNGSGKVVESKLFAKDLDVLIDTGKGLLKIGKLEESNEGLELSLEDAISFELKVGSASDDLATWEAGDSAPYKIERIYIFI